MAAIAAQSISRAAATAVTFSNVNAGGDTVPCGDGYTLLIKNDDASSKTVTLVTTQTVDGLAVTDTAITVAAGAIHAAKLGPRKLYANTSGRVDLSYSAATNLKVAVLAH